MTQAVDLAIIILTKDEELHIERCIRSVGAIAAEIFVVDSFSADCTVEKARSAGATVEQHPFVNYSSQFQWALDHLPITSKWIMRLDADELIEPALANEIASKLPILSGDITGVFLPRRLIFLGKPLLFGGRGKIFLLRIFRRGCARIENRWMDEHIMLFGGKAVVFKHTFVDHNLKPLKMFVDKHNHYATKEAIDFFTEEVEGAGQKLEGLASVRIRMKRLIKMKVFYRLPIGLGPLAYFLYRYVILFGFLDGKTGLIYHVLQGLWYRFLVQAKIREMIQK